MPTIEIHTDSNKVRVDTDAQPLTPVEYIIRYSVLWLAFSLALYATWNVLVWQSNPFGMAHISYRAAMSVVANVFIIGTAFRGRV